MATGKITRRRAAVLFLFSLSLVFCSTPADGNEKEAKYNFPESAPGTYAGALRNAGWDNEKIKRFSAVYARYRRAHAFVELAEAIPGKHILLLAEWINVLTKHNVDPYLTAGIHPHEVYHGVEIGKCSFYGSDGADEEAAEKENNRMKREKEAFDVIIADIRKNPQWRNMNPALPRVSCRGGDIGYFQIRPTVWLEYRDRVLAVLDLKTSSPYELIPAMVAVNLILHDTTRRLKLDPSEVTLSNSLYFAKVAASYNLGAAGVEKCLTTYGEAVYHTASRLKKAAERRAAPTPQKKSK